MPCYHPMKGFYYGKTDSGKDNLIITSYNVDHIEVNGKGRIVRKYDYAANRNMQVLRKYTEIPCGKCIGCRMSTAREWSDRIFLEMKEHEENCFLTLTYNDENLPFNKRPVVNNETGEIITYELAASLRKSDISDFIKALRNKLNYKGTNKNGDPVYYKKGDPEFKEIKFYAAGEYGPTTKRPHAHIIIFGFDPTKHESDLKIVGKNDLDMYYYSSPFIYSIWKKGNNIVSEASYKTGAYVARYCQKKAFGKDKKFFEDNGIEPEFTLMSRNPGIGKTWFNAHKECYAGFSYMDFPTDKGNQRIYPNRYFDKLMENEDDDPDLDEVSYRDSMFERKKERRYFKEEAKKIKYTGTSKEYLDALKDEETNFIRRTKVLTRNKV